MEVKEVYEEIYKMGIFLNPKIAYKETVDLSSRTLDSDIFSPSLPYDGDRDIFMINSLIKDGKNLYLEFLNRNLYSKLDFNGKTPSGKTIFNQEKLLERVLPYLSLRSNNKGKKRMLTFNYEYTLIKIFGILRMSPEYKETYNSFCSAVLDSIDERLNVLNSVLKEGKLTNGYNELIKKWYSIDLKNEDDAKEDAKLIKLHDLEHTKTNKKLNILDGYRDLLIKVKKIIIDIKNKKFKIDVNELMACFDIEKFYLMLAKSTLDFAITMGDKGVGPLSCVSEVRSYVYYLVEQLGSDYNPAIEVYDKEAGKIVQYDFKTLKKELDKYQEKFPEQVLELSLKEIFENNIRTVDEAREYAAAKKKEEFTVSWELLKKGDGAENPFSRGRSRRIGKRNSRNDISDEIGERMDFLYQTDYKYRAVGLNKFDGYVAFIYENGVVILEKLYSNIEEETITKVSGATYVMSIYDFTEFSKLTKTEIIEYISSTDNPKVKRFYHTKTWQDRITRYLNGIKISIDDKIRIKKYIESNILPYAKK